MTLTKLFTLIKKNRYLVFILILACLLRFGGIYPSYPPEHTDEGGYSSAYSMIISGKLDPTRYDYPSGVAIIQFILFKVIFIPISWLIFYLKDLNNLKLITSPEARYLAFHLNILGEGGSNALFWGRYITAFFGVGVVALTYLLTNRVFGKFSALISALFVAINFREVLNSHIGLPDIFNAFFLLLALISCLRLLENPSRKNYLLTGVAHALYFSIKFQVFAFLPFLIIHTYCIWKKSGKKLKNFLISYINKNLLLSLLTFLFLILLINPYHLINFAKFKEIQDYQLSKYAAGTYRLNLFSYSYLYQFGLGQILSILVILGIIIGFIKHFFKSLLIFSSIASFMFVFTYYSQGGFYTRNFVTVIPLLLFFAGLPFLELKIALGKFLKKNKKGPFAALVIVILIGLVSWSNLEKSIKITQEYAQPWNKSLLSSWIEKNIANNSSVSSHPSISLNSGIKRFILETDQSFSIDEFKEVGNEDYAIVNFMWATSSFYWWMSENLWSKPIDILEYSYPAIALREMSDSSIFSVLNPWEAPEFDYMVVKIPEFKVSKKEQVVIYSFEEGTEGWGKSGKFWKKEDNLGWEKGSLSILEKDPGLPSIRWSSPTIEVSDWSGYVIDFKTRSDSSLPSVKAGFIYASFYQTKEDALNSKNRVGVRVSSRTSTPNLWLDKSLVGSVPPGAKYMTIGFLGYDAAKSISKLDFLKVSRAEVEIDYKGSTIQPININQNNLFPNSHGNL